MVHAAVAVMQRPSGEVLLAERPAGKGWAGWWEFPGGKVEANEAPIQALQREMQEELGTKATEAYPWITRTFAYPEKTVCLHFFIVRAWTNEPHGKEGQQLRWQYPHRLEVSPMLPANLPVLQWLTMPAQYAISDASAMGVPQFLARLEQRLAAGLRMVQVREKSMPDALLVDFAQAVIARCKPYGANVIVNHRPEIARQCGADGVHLSSQRLMSLEQRPEGMLCGASCHNAEQLMRAAALELDYAMFSPVLPTQSHPESEGMGWDAFAQAISGYALPVYALGGMTPEHLKTAWQHGAHGISMLRSAWV